MGRQNQDRTIKFALHFFPVDELGTKTIKLKGRIFPKANPTRKIGGVKENGKMFNNLKGILTSLIQVLDKSGINIAEKDKNSKWNIVDMKDILNKLT